MTITARELSRMKLGQRTLDVATLQVNLCKALPLSMQPETREITQVFVPAADRKQGLGSRLVKQVCREADDAGVTLLLTCANSLRRWYARFGFTVLQDDIGLMVRPIGAQQLELNKTARAIDGALAQYH